MVSNDERVKILTDCAEDEDCREEDDEEGARDVTLDRAVELRHAHVRRVVVARVAPQLGRKYRRKLARRRQRRKTDVAFHRATAVALLSSWRIEIGFCRNKLSKRSNRKAGASRR